LYKGSAPSTAISAFSGSSEKRLGGGIIFSTVPGRVTVAFFVLLTFYSILLGSNVSRIDGAAGKEELDVLCREGCYVVDHLNRVGTTNLLGVGAATLPWNQYEISIPRRLASSKSVTDDQAQFGSRPGVQASLHFKKGATAILRSDQDVESGFVVEVAEIDLPASLKVLVNENHGGPGADVGGPISLSIACRKSVNTFKIERDQISHFPKGKFGVGPKLDTRMKYRPDLARRKETTPD